MVYVLFIGLIVVGLVLLAYGGDWIVDGGVGLAKNLGVTPLVIGIVFLGFATSLPELFTSLNGAFQDSPGVALGNVVGSNIANLLLIAGVTSALAATKVKESMIWRDGLFVLFSSALLVYFLFWLGGVNFWTGLALFSVLVIYLVISIWNGRRKAKEQAAREALAAKGAQSQTAEVAKDEDKDLGMSSSIFWFAVGISATFLGAYCLVEGAVGIARTHGASESLIGLTVVAFGTSLPELAAAIAAGRRNKPELVVGNVLGSNMFNIGAVVGVTAMLTPLNTPMDLTEFDVMVMLLGTTLMLVLAWRGAELSRNEGRVLLLAYCLYIAAIALAPELRTGQAQYPGSLFGVEGVGSVFLPKGGG